MACTFVSSGQAIIDGTGEKSRAQLESRGPRFLRALDCALYSGGVTVIDELEYSSNVLHVRYPKPVCSSNATISRQELHFISSNVQLRYIVSVFG